MKILAAVDGSEPSLHAVAYAVGPVSQLSSGPHSITLASVHGDVGLRHAKAPVVLVK